MDKLFAWNKARPLHAIFWCGLLLRLLAAIFAKGYGWHDDQFLVIEIAQSWLDGVDFYGWLPNTQGTNIPEGFSFFYPGLHFVLFWLLEFLGLTDPQTKMLIVGILHALWSMVIVVFGYKTTLLIAGKKPAAQVGWLLATFWIFPFLSVRNLVEYASIPFLMVGLWMIITGQKNQRFALWFLVAGLVFGMAFNVRFQTLIVTGGFGLALLFQQRWKETFLVALGTLISILAVQVTVDYFVWGKPLVQFIEYVDYNMHNAALYIVSPWYTYLLFLLGIMIPPVSIFIFAGYFYSWKKLSILFVPILIFMIFHSYYPNKQERFVVTIMPFLFMAGVVGWQRMVQLWNENKKTMKWITGSWMFFWIVNFILLVPVTVMYSKKARVESMAYLSQYDQIQHFLIEDEQQTVLRFPPQYYLKKWINYDTFMRNDSISGYRGKIAQGGTVPDFVLFFQPDNLDRRVDSMLTIFPELEYEATIEPGFMDKVIYWLNPINDNQIITIYRNSATIAKTTAK